MWNNTKIKKKKKKTSVDWSLKQLWPTSTCDNYSTIGSLLSAEKEKNEEDTPNPEQVYIGTTIDRMKWKGLTRQIDTQHK